MKRKNPYYDSSMWKGAPSDNFSRAQQLRENMTAPEKVLWEKLQLESFKKFNFRRQHPIHKYIVDFYSHSLKLVIEIDGKYHDSEKQKISDAERADLLEFQGLEIMRFSNSEVLAETESILGRLESRIKIIKDKTFPGSL